MKSPASRNFFLLLFTLSLLYISIGAQEQTENECSENKDCGKPEFEAYECVNGTCLCSENENVYTSDAEYKCLKLANINGSCGLDKQCSYLTNHSKCEDGICECMPEFVYFANEGLCEPLLTLNRTQNGCSQNKDCEKAYESYECENGTCVCSKTDVYTHDPKYKCLKLVNMNGSCEIQEQCAYQTRGSNCSNGSCQCASGSLYSALARTCNSPKPPGSGGPFLIILIGVAVIIIAFVICCCCCCKKKKDVNQVHSRKN